MHRLLVDENAMRLFTDSNWIKLREILESYGFVFYELPRWLYGRPDSELVDFIIRNELDGIITEDHDFVESNRYTLFHELTKNNKEIYLVQRVPSTAEKYELRVYRYVNGVKMFCLKMKPDGTISTDPQV